MKRPWTECVGNDCNNIIASGDNFCSRCGTRVTDAQKNMFIYIRKLDEKRSNWTLFPPLILGMPVFLFMLRYFPPTHQVPIPPLVMNLAIAIPCFMFSWVFFGAFLGEAIVSSKAKKRWRA